MPSYNNAIVPSPSLAASRYYKWLVAAALFCCSTINYADRTSITALFTLLKADLGYTDVGLGALGSVFLWSYALSSPLAGYCGDRLSRGRLIVGSLTAWSAVMALTGLVSSQWQLLAMRGALGIVEALYLPAALALVTEYHGPDTRATAMGIVALGNFIGMMLGGSLAGYLGELYGWRTPLVVLGVAGLALAAIVVFLLPWQPGEAVARGGGASFPRAAGQLLRTRSFLVVAAAGVLTAIGTWIFINWLPLYFRENLSMTLTTAGLFGSSVVSLSAAVGQAAGGVLSDRVARGGAHRRMWLQAVLIACAAPMLLAFVLTRNPYVILTALVLYSFLRGGADLNLLPLMTDLAGPHRSSTAVGLTNMANNLTGGLGVFLAGYLKAGFGLEGVFAGLTGILLIDAVMLYAGYRLFLREDLCAAA